MVGNQGGAPALALAPASASPQDQGRGGGRSPSTGQAGGRCRRVRRVRGIGAVGASPRGQAIPVTRRVRAVGASDPLPGDRAMLGRAGSARSGPSVRPSGQRDSGNAPDPCARGLRCVPRGKAIPGTRWVRTPGLRSACSGPSDLVARTWPRHC